MKANMYIQVYCPSCDLVMIAINKKMLTCYCSEYSGRFFEIPQVELVEIEK
jgi:hypothetical protein